MVVGFMTTYAISAYHPVRWFSLGTPVSSTNKTDQHDITEILLKVVLNTISLKNINSANCLIKELTNFTRWVVVGFKIYFILLSAKSLL
jgi:hypothetical protein